MPGSGSPVSRHHRYNVSEKGRARQARYERTRIQVQAGGLRWTYRVPADRKAELAEMLAGFRRAQRIEVSEPSAQRGRIDPR